MNVQQSFIMLRIWQIYLCKKIRSKSLKFLVPVLVTKKLVFDKGPNVKYVSSINDSFSKNLSLVISNKWGAVGPKQGFCPSFRANIACRLSRNLVQCTLRSHSAVKAKETDSVPPNTHFQSMCSPIISTG